MAHPDALNDTPQTVRPGVPQARNPTTPGDLPVAPTCPRPAVDSHNPARLGVTHPLRDRPGEPLLLLHQHRATPALLHSSHRNLRITSVLRRSLESAPSHWGQFRLPGGDLGRFSAASAGAAPGARGEGSANWVGKQLDRCFRGTTTLVTPNREPFSSASSRVPSPNTMHPRSLTPQRRQCLHWRGPRNTYGVGR